MVFVACRRADKWEIKVGILEGTIIGIDFVHEQRDILIDSITAY